MDDIYDDDLPLPPNGAAYMKTEVRSGPPLDYVASKLKHALESIHDTYRACERHRSRAGGGNTAESAASMSAADVDDLQSPTRLAFHYALVSYLALNNMLAGYTPNLSEQLLRKSGSAFRTWLDRLTEVGSVTG